VVICRITIVILGLGAGGDDGLHGQVDDMGEAPRWCAHKSAQIAAREENNLPDLSTFDVETHTGFRFVTACKFGQHGVVILRIITRYMSYL
jgi:hypothetical protein